MKVFISWSGERSRALASALHEWLPLVLHFVEPWLSQADIEAGQRWAEQVAKELEATNFGIICLTRDNVSAPWVLFEAGALAKSIQGSRVIPLLLDLEFRDIAGPLAQFQAKKADLKGVNEIIQALNQCAPQPVQEERVKQLFEALWPDFEKKVSSISAASTPPKHTRSQHEVLEELVASVRSLDARFRHGMEFPPRGRRRLRQVHPMMLRDLSHLMGSSATDPIVLLMIASIFREDMPWMYELGLEAYRAARDGSPEEALTARRRFEAAAEFLRRGPFPLEELGLDPHWMHMLLREFDHVIAVPEDSAAPPPQPSSVSARPRSAPLKPKRKRSGK